MFNLVHSLRTERERLITEILSHIEERGERAPGENPEYLVRSLVNALIVALVQGKPGHFVTFVRNCARREARLGRGRRLLVVWYALEALEDWLWALSLDDDTALAGMMRWERVKSYLDGGKTALVRTYLEVMEQESQRLMNALETYVHLTENVPAIVYSMDEQGRFTSISHTAIRLLGYSQEELLGQHYSKLMDPEEAERFGRMLSERRTGERATKRLRVRLRDRAGNLREFEVSATGVYDDEGRFLGTDGIAREPIGPQALFSYTLDAEGHFTALSEGVTELLGYTPEELVGQHFSVLMDETEFVLMGRFFGERRQGGRASRRVKITLRDRKGEPHEFEITARGRYDEEGTFLGTEGTARDLTEQSRLEREIVEERSKFQAVFEAAGVGLSLIGADYRVQEANQYQRSLTNGSDLEGQLCYAVYFGRETPCPWCGLTEALMTGQTIVRHSVHHPESERVYNLSFAPVRDALGESVGVIEALIDVTPLHDLAQRFARSEKLRLLGQLAGGLAHELSNVLATVSGRAQLLLRHVEEEEVQRTLRLITEAATTAAQQLRRMQSLARVGKASAPLGSCDLNAAVREALKLTRPRWRDEAQREGVTIEVKTALQEPLPPVQANQQDLVEALVNLMVNAIEAMPEGGTLTVRTGWYGEQLHVSIEDTGVGMSEEVRAQMFDPFFTTKGHDASGLGLSVSYGIVDRSGGKLWAESREGRGTTFHLTLPPGEEQPEETVPPPEAAPGPRRILVVEDEENLRLLLTELLEEEGHEVVSCASGEEALERFREQPCDLVFTDLGMPGISGWEVAAAIKDLDASVPVVVVTGWEGQVDEVEAAEHPVDAVLGKPYDLNEVLHLVNTLGRSAAP